jgi:aspartate carbamoyltransferase catalytic subunit
LTQKQIMALQSHFQLQEKHLELMKKNAILLHPGPVLWGKEISDDLRKNNCVKINEQVAAGVIIREALLALDSRK